MKKNKRKKFHIIGFLIAAIITSIFMFALISRIPIYGIASNIIVMLPEGKSQSYANHVTGNVAGIIQNAFDDKKIAGVPTSIVVKRDKNGGLITINVYENSTSEAFKLHELLLNSLKKEVSIYYPESTGIIIKSVGQSYKTIRLSYVFGIILVSIILGWLLVLHLSELISNFFPNENSDKMKEEEKYEELIVNNDISVKDILTQENPKEKINKDGAYTWSDLGRNKDYESINEDFLENNKGDNNDFEQQREMLKNDREKEENNSSLSNQEIESVKHDLLDVEEKDIKNIENDNNLYSQVNGVLDYNEEEFVQNDAINSGFETLQNNLNKHNDNKHVLNNEEKELVKDEVKDTDFFDAKQSVKSENEVEEIRDNNAINDKMSINNKVDSLEEDNIVNDNEEISNSVERVNVADDVEKKDNLEPTLERIDSEKNSEYLNSLGPIGFRGSVKNPTGAYEYVPKDQVADEIDVKKIEEVRNDFNNNLASIGVTENAKQEVEDKKQSNDIKEWSDVNDKVINQFRDASLTEGEELNLNEQNPFAEVNHTESALKEVKEEIFADSNKVSELQIKDSRIEKTITGGLALPEVEEKYVENEESKKVNSSTEKVYREPTKIKEVSSSGATAFAPGNLPIVEMNNEVQEENLQKDEIDVEGSKMVEEFEKEPSDEELKRRLNELLNGSM